MLAAALGWVAEEMADARDPWWIIGSAAVALHGGETSVADIDLLTSERDARALLARHDGAAPPAPSDLFRSRVFGQIGGAALPVEVMAGFAVRTAAGWREILPRSRVPIGGVFVPEAGELLAMLETFGRAKDHSRALSLSRAFGIVAQ
jgi:hypothetical protein